MLRLSNQFICTFALLLALAGSALAYSGGTGTGGDPYQLATPADWQQFMEPSDWGAHFILTADIDLGGVALTPVGNMSLLFTGTLDGQGHVIRNAAINTPDDDYVALFGVVGSGCQIRNLGMESAYFYGYSRVGALVGENDGGTLVNCCSTGSVFGMWGNAGGLVGTNYQGDMTDCRSACDVGGGRALGGLVGYNYSPTLTRCFATGSVSGFYERAGGLAGNNVGTLNDCYATGNVSSSSQMVGGLVGSNGGSLARCYSTGSVSGSINVGGLIGSNNPSDVSNCFWNTTTAGSTGVGTGSSTGIYGRTTTQMKQRATFTAYTWDFLGDSGGTADTWRMCSDGANYPHLTWEYVKTGDFACPDGIAMDDLRRLANDWLLTYSTPRYGADATGDSSVNFADFATLAANWMQ